MPISNAHAHSITNGNSSHPDPHAKNRANSKSVAVQKVEFKKAPAIDASTAGGRAD
jgi:hypothetical protein